MSKTAILSVRMVGDARNLTAAFQSATGGLDKWEGRTKKAATAMSVASAGIIAFGSQAVSAASDLEQSVGAVSSVFEDQAGKMTAWAENAADAVGLSQNSYNNFATVIGSQLKNLGIPMDQVGNKTNDLIELGADLASMYGGTTADAVDALSAVFRGETDPIERYGVSIKQSDVNARMAADGLDGLQGAALKQAEAETRLKLVTEQTAAAHGNFAREADTVAHKQQVASAKFEDAKAKLGAGLLPVVATVTDKFAGLASTLGEHPGLVAAVAGSILGLTGALWTAWAAMKIWSTASAITTGVKNAWGLMAKAMAADNAAVEASSKGGAIRSAAAWIANGARAAGAWVLMKVRAVGSFVATAAAATAHAAATAATWIAAGARAAGAWVIMQARAVGSFVATAASAVASAAATAAAWVASAARAAAAFVAQNAAMLAVRGATLAMAAAQGVLNAVMAMNPIMLVVIAITALVAALVLAYNKSATFRSIVQSVGAVASSVFNGIVGFVRNVISTIGNLISRAGGIGGAFRSAMSAAKAAVNILMTPIRGLINLVSSLIGWISKIRFPSVPGWVSKINPFSRSAAPQTARMSSMANMATMAYGARMSTMAAPARYAAEPTPTLTARASRASLGGALSSLVRAADGMVAGGQGKPTEVVNVTVNVKGAVLADDLALAETIERALTKSNRATGRTTVVGR